MCQYLIFDRGVCREVVKETVKVFPSLIHNNQYILEVTHLHLFSPLILFLFRCCLQQLTNYLSRVFVALPQGFFSVHCFLEHWRLSHVPVTEILKSASLVAERCLVCQLVFWAGSGFGRTLHNSIPSRSCLSWLPLGGKGE